MEEGVAAVVANVSAVPVAVAAHCGPGEAGGIHAVGGWIEEGGIQQGVGRRNACRKGAN